MDGLVPQQRRTPLHPRYDAIHRALLTGLLSNIGTKSETHEYLGPRGVRFKIHPGSAQFAAKPKWLMAAELVETTKLYARTCAGIQPQWIERAAAHLVERTYSEPRWDAKSASVLASEKVTLHGLVIVPSRLVPYSPINPKQSREMFIQHALVLGDCTPPHTQAPFVRHNARLVEEVQGMEAKIRQRNLLADAATRFAFYDARVPLEVTNGAEFESWRQRAENPRAGNPRTLFMDKADLLRADAPPITPENYPDRLADNLAGRGNLHLPLAYAFQPGDANDGLTLSVPVAALAQLRPEQYEWLVPGMLEEKIAAMLRELSGGLRRNFVPVPTWAKSAAEALAKEFPHGENAGGSSHAGEDRDMENKKPKIEKVPSLKGALAEYLGKQTGVEISEADFPEAVLPPHLRMAFRILSDDGRVLGISRDLPQIQRQLAPHAADSFGTLYSRHFHRDHITSWDFGDLPESMTVQRYGMDIRAFPALTAPDTPPAATPGHLEPCALRLLPTKDAAEAAHRAGVRRLFRLEYRKDVKSLATNLPEFPKMALQHFTLGQSRQLREDLVTLVTDRALFADHPVPRKPAEWDALKHVAATRLFATGDTVAALAGTILENYHYLTLAIDRGVTAAYSRITPAVTDVKDQLLFLIPSHFLLTTPFEWLQHMPRYLAAAGLRLEKLDKGNAAVATRDTDAREQFAPFWAQFLHRKSQHEAIGLADPELATFRWMLEEYRVHLFAQELGTAMQVSPKRLERQWEKVRQ
jgi:ATP-dependent helicase HrpA